MRKLLLSLAVALAVGSVNSQVTVDSTKTRTPQPFAGTFTWATKPTCDTGLSGAGARISDVGISPGISIVCDGTRWVTDGIQVLARSAVAVSHTGDVNETTLATVTVPAGILGISGSLRVTPLYTTTNSANNKTLRVDFGGTDYWSFVVTTSVSEVAQITIRNRAATNSQIGGQLLTSSGFSFSTNAFVTSAVVSLTLTGQLANAGETVTLEGYTVEILP